MTNGEAQLQLIDRDPLPVEDLVEPAERGAVYTREWVVEWILDLVGYQGTSRDLAAGTLVEPACGGGAFLVPAVRRLAAVARSHDLGGTDLLESIWAADLSRCSVDESRERTADALGEAGFSRRDSRKLASAWIRHDDFLLAEIPECEWVVGNPPYVRLEDVDAARTRRYRSACPTMVGRADLYVGFFERGLGVLSAGGHLAFICADRWMRNTYGRRLRELIHSGSFSVDTTIRLHDVDCFEDEVSSYPAITVVTRQERQRDGVFVDTSQEFAPTSVGAVSAFVDSKRREAKGPGFVASRIKGWFGPGLWPEATPSRLRLLGSLEQAFPKLEDPRGETRVGIGVATGADAIFVTSDGSLVEPARLLPLVKAEHISRGHLDWRPTYLVNPWDQHGLVDAARYPRFFAYLNHHGERLRARHVGKKNPNAWFRTIDRVHPWLVDQPKVLLADLKARATPVVDPGGLYPHHNIYWLTSTTWPIEALAGFCLSDALDLFVRSYCVKMRGGTLRFQAQYLRTVRVPSPTEVRPELLEQLALAYRNRDREQATHAAARLYGLAPDELRA